MRRTPLLCFVLLTFVVAPASAANGVWMSAYPGDTLYGLKISWENLHEWTVWNPTAKAELRMAHAQERLAEAQTLYVRGNLEGMQEALARHVQKLAETAETPQGRMMTAQVAPAAESVLSSLLAATNQSDPRYGGLSTALAAVKRHRPLAAAPELHGDCFDSTGGVVTCPIA